MSTENTPREIEKVREKLWECIITPHYDYLRNVPEADDLVPEADDLTETNPSTKIKNIFIDAIDTKFGTLLPEGLKKWEETTAEERRVAETSRPPFFRRLEAVVGTFVAVSDSERDIKVIGKAVDKITEKIIAAGYGKYSPYFGRLNFHAVSILKQSYWTARQTRRSRESRFSARPKTKRHFTDKVIRVNDVAFAEAVHPFLMGEYAPEHGYSIEIVPNIDPSEVAIALYTNRIDVGFYNWGIDRQFKALDKRFDHRRLIFRTRDPLFKYVGYPILRRRDFDRKAEANGKAAYKIAVPWGADFEEVIESQSDETPNSHHMTYSISKKMDPNSGKLQIEIHRKNGIIPVQSVEEGLRRFIDGELEYCMTGGLQRDYALEQFKALVEDCGYMNREHPKSHCLGTADPGGAQLKPPDKRGVHFWAAVETRHEAETLLYPMIQIWNEHVVGRWPAVVRGLGTEMKVLRDKLLELVNSYDQGVFVKEFKDLAELITNHDEFFPKKIGFGLEPHTVYE